MQLLPAGGFKDVETTVLLYDEPVAVRAINQWIRRCNWNRAQLASAFHVPKAQCIIFAAGSELVSVRTEGQGPHSCLVSMQGASDFAACKIPKLDSSIFTPPFQSMTATGGGVQVPSWAESPR